MRKLICQIIGHKFDQIGESGVYGCHRCQAFLRYDTKGDLHMVNPFKEIEQAFSLVGERLSMSETGRAYNRVAQEGYANRLSRDILQKKSEFERSWSEFRRNTLEAVPPEYRFAVENLLDQEFPRWKKKDDGKEDA